jgi:hypothetical protein
MVVPIAVGLHLVAPAADLGHQVGVGRHLRSEAEEGGGERELIEAVEDPRRGAGIRAVIKGQRYRVGRGAPPPAELSGKGTEA